MKPEDKPDIIINDSSGVNTARTIEETLWQYYATNPLTYINGDKLAEHLKNHQDEWKSVPKEEQEVMQPTKFYTKEEADKFTISPNALRDNQNKLDFTLLPVAACEAETKVWMHGAKKYGRTNWRKLWGADTVDITMASLLRHAFAILDGESRDKESGEYHAAHIRCNAAMLIEYQEII